jgi:DNA-binding MarR family transcriptional regulator
MTMSELAEIESIAAPSATGIVSRLVDRGLVERRPHSNDRRCSVVGLTDKGRAELGAIREERNVFLANWLESLDEDERQVLARAAQILDRLVEAE